MGTNTTPTMDQLINLFTYDEQANYWDFKIGDWWKLDEIITADNLTWSKAYEFEESLDYTGWFCKNVVP